VSHHEPPPEDESDPDTPAEGDAGVLTADSAAEPAAHNLRRVAEWVVLIVVALAVAFTLRIFVVQSFYIPSESMTPTLQVGDRVLVNKLAYRFGDPKRGDIVVFEAPPGEGSATVHDLIKRVVGLPGEKIEGRDGDIYVDDRRLEESWLPDGVRSREFGPVRIPDDHYWVLGDNRQGSRDSTFFKSIPRDSIVGEAFVRMWPIPDIGFI